LSFDHLFIKDIGGERRVDASSLPLRAGTSGDCEIRLPGPGSSPVMVLDLLDGAPFVQPLGRDESMRINGKPLLASTRLADGDELQYFGSRIFVVATKERLTLEVRLEDSAYVTQPPETPDEAAQAASDTIAPTAFRRAAKTHAVTAETGGSRLKFILGAGLAILLFASYLLFSSKSVRFDVDPAEPDYISISGGWFQFPIGDRLLLRGGDYTVSVRKQGYYDVNQNFVVGSEPSITVDIAMRRLPGELIVITEPAVDAVVTIDNSRIGKAPFGPIELQPGQHSLSVSAERYLPFSHIVEVPGLGKRERVYVQLVRRWSNVEITSEPAGASIFSGDQQVGETPATVEFLEGTHQISVVREGFKAWDGTVIAKPNIDQALPLVQLQPANAKLLVNSIPRAANVTVDGRYRGQSPITLALSPDVDYEIGLSKAGYGGTSRSIRLQAAASDSITVDLTARTGTLTVNVSPPDARIFVDGRRQGSGSRTLRLSSAPHRVEVRKAGYESWSRTITPRPGYPQTVTARLRSNEAIERAKVALTLETAAGQTLRRVQPGTFMMGASRSEQGRRANEVLVPVTVSRPFLISVHEVTNSEFSKFRPKHDSGSDISPSMGGGKNPVANITWSDAVQYCNWLSAREGLAPAYVDKFGEWVSARPTPSGYRLPTEAEWAWAIRYEGSAGARTFNWGSKMPPRRNSGNFSDKAALGFVPTILPRYDDGFATTAPVGQFSPSAIGIYDGGGNVAEWINDYYTVPTPGVTTPIVDPLGPDKGTSHVVRGSGWRHAGETELRLSYRDYSDKARSDVGFRIVRNAD